MLKDIENIHIIVVVSEEEMCEGISGLLENAGMNIRRSDSIENLMRCIQDNPAVILPLPEEDGDRKAFIDLIDTARRSYQSASCYIITSEKLSHISENLTTFTRQPVKKRVNRKTLSEVERDHIINILNETKWQYTTTAKLLGINRATLYRKLKKYGLSKKRE